MILRPQALLQVLRHQAHRPDLRLDALHGRHLLDPAGASGVADDLDDVGTDAHLPGARQGAVDLGLDVAVGGQEELGTHVDILLADLAGAWLKNSCVLEGGGRSLQSGLWFDLGGLEIGQNSSLASL